MQVFYYWVRASFSECAHTYRKQVVVETQTWKLTRRWEKVIALMAVCEGRTISDLNGSGQMWRFPLCSVSSPHLHTTGKKHIIRNSVQKSLAVHRWSLLSNPVVPSFFVCMVLSELTSNATHCLPLISITDGIYQQTEKGTNNCFCADTKKHDDLFCSLCSNDFFNGLQNLQVKSSKM